jgi:hypothetical protein
MVVGCFGNIFAVYICQFSGGFGFWGILMKFYFSNNGGTFFEKFGTV